MIEHGPKYDGGIPENDVPGTFSHTDPIRPTLNAPDVENGGNVPNTSIGWEIGKFDRMEGSKKGQNKPSQFGGSRNQIVKQNTGKPIRE